MQRLDCILCSSNISIPNVTYSAEKNLKYNDEKISKEILLSFERYTLENVYYHRNHPETLVSPKFTMSSVGLCLYDA